MTSGAKRGFAWIGLLLSAALSASASHAAGSIPLKVASYNVWGLPSPLLRHGERWRELPSAVNALDADVVLIQEAFNKESRALTMLPKFPYHAWGPQAAFPRFSSGLLILSRFPIVLEASTKYSHCGGFDCFSNKGALLARILVPGVGPVNVFDTHLNANGYDSVRQAQAAELMKFVARLSDGFPSIVGGDFNGEGAPLISKLVKTLVIRDAHAEFAESHPLASRLDLADFSADPVRNPFLGRSETQRRLDHLFFIDGERPNDRWTTLDYGLVLDGTRGKVLSDHFGVRSLATLSPPSG